MLLLHWASTDGLEWIQAGMQHSAFIRPSSKSRVPYHEKRFRSMAIALFTPICGSLGMSLCFARATLLSLLPSSPQFTRRHVCPSRSHFRSQTFVITQVQPQARAAAVALRQAIVCQSAKDVLELSEESVEQTLQVSHSSKPN